MLKYVKVTRYGVITMDHGLSTELNLHGSTSLFQIRIAPHLTGRWSNTSGYKTMENHTVPSLGHAYTHLRLEVLTC